MTSFQPSNIYLCLTLMISTYLHFLPSSLFPSSLVLIIPSRMPDICIKLFTAEELGSWYHCAEDGPRTEVPSSDEVQSGGCSVTKSCLTLRPMDCNRPLLALHYLQVQNSHPLKMMKWGQNISGLTFPRSHRPIVVTAGLLAQKYLQDSASNNSLLISHFATFL